LGTFCARGFFDYVERTYANHIVVTAEFEGYEQPLVVWTINGGPVPLGGGAIEVAATWELQPPTLPASNKSPTQGSVDGTSPKPPIALLNVGFNGWSANSSKLDIFVGPGQGNAVLTVTAQVSELFDDPSVGGRGHTIRKAIIPVDHKNEEIAWGDAYNQAKQQCDDIHRLGRDPSGALGVPKPGDPPDLVTLITRAIRDQSARRKNLLLEAADHVTASRPELADLLIGLAQRTN